MTKNVKIVLISIFILVILTFIVIEGYNYYKTKYIPKHFIESFLEELEKNGPAVSINHPYFISDFTINPGIGQIKSKPLIKAWQDYYLETKKDSISQQYSPAIEELFDIWKKVHVSIIEDYLVSTPTLQDPSLHLYTDKYFKELYMDLIFKDIKLKDIDFTNENEIHAYGYTKILGNMYFSGERRFDLYVKNGKLGWKIKLFIIK